MTKQEALDMLYEGDLYDAFGYVTADGYAALAALDGVVLQECKTGKWIDHSEEGYGYVECPICGYLTTCEGNKEDLHYCFWCGAKMEVEDDTNDTE